MRTILGEEIQYRLSDPRIPTVTSVTRVEVAQDFSVARVYVSVMGDDTQRQNCLAALDKAAGHLRWCVGRQMQIRKLPTLQFRLDESLQRSFETVEAIDRAMRDLGEIPEWERADEGDPPIDEPASDTDHENTSDETDAPTDA